RSPAPRTSPRGAPAACSSSSWRFSLDTANEGYVVEPDVEASVLRIEFPFKGNQLLGADFGAAVAPVRLLQEPVEQHRVLLPLVGETNLDAEVVVAVAAPAPLRGGIAIGDLEANLARALGPEGHALVA